MDLNLNYSDDENPLSLKSDFILSLCELIVGGKDGLQPVEKTIIDRCVRMVYRNYLNDPRPENMPVLEDLYNALRQQDEKEAQYIATALEIYVTGSLNVFNHRTNVNVNNRVANLKPGSAYDGLYESALCRSKADWLVGINATRLFSVLYHRPLNVGRVMSPTLALLVQRESEIDAFKPEPFFTVNLSGLINDRANRLAFSDDSSYYLLCSLEVLDDDGRLERKADMFTNAECGRAFHHGCAEVQRYVFQVPVY